MKTYKKIFFATICLLLCVVSLWLLLHRNTNTTKYSADEARYYKAVHAMHCINPASLDVKVNIPGAFIRHDDTVALIHHPDKIFVFQFLAKELTLLAPSFPKAQLFAAHAHIALGEYSEAARLLTNYVATTPYDPKIYELLCKARSINKEYLSQYLVCLEWQKKDPSCSKARLMYTWSAYFNLERYADAIATMVNEGDCLGYTRFLYAARAAFAYEDMLATRAFLQAAQESSTSDQEKIELLWERLLNNPNL